MPDVLLDISAVHQNACFLHTGLESRPDDFIGDQWSQLSRMIHSQRTCILRQQLQQHPSPSICNRRLKLFHVTERRAGIWKNLNSLRSGNMLHVDRPHHPHSGGIHNRHTRQTHQAVPSGRHTAPWRRRKIACSRGGAAAWKQRLQLQVLIVSLTFFITLEEKYGGRRWPPPN